jgi:hypothetical protein
VSNQQSEFVGPGKLFETEEEEFAERIELLEWATQVSPEKLAQFKRAIRKEIQRRGENGQKD